MDPRTTAAERLKRACERAGIGLGELHREIQDRLGITFPKSSLQYYWGDGEPAFKGSHIPLDKPFQRALREVLMSRNQISRDDLTAIFGLDDLHSAEIRAEIAELRDEVHDLGQQIRDLKPLLLALRDKTPHQ